MSGGGRSVLVLLILVWADVAHPLSAAEIGSALLQASVQAAHKPVHALALLALGLLLGQRRADCAQALGVFAAALAAGLLAIALAVGATPAAEILLASAALAGLLIAAQWALPRLLGWLLAALTGVSIGLDSPPTATSIAAANAALVGSGVGSFIMLAAAASVALLIRYDWQRIGLRIAGSWIAASAILTLALALGRQQ